MNPWARLLARMVLGETLEFETDAFDAVTCVGVLTFGHAPASSLDEFVRVTKPGGHVTFTGRPDVREQVGLIEKEAELRDAGLWKLIEVTDEFASLPKGLLASMVKIRRRVRLAPADRPAGAHEPRAPSTRPLT